MASASESNKKRRTQLHKSRILVDKSGGFLFGKKMFKLVVEEDGRDVPVLQASSGKGSFLWWRKGMYSIYGQANNSQEGPKGCKVAPEEGIGEHWELVGKIASPGWFYDRSVIYNEHGNAKAATLYSCTSRTGDLMRMEVALPKVHIENARQLGSMISKSCILPRDCASVVASFVGNLYWSEDFVEIDPSNCHRLFDRSQTESATTVDAPFRSDDDEKTPSESDEVDTQSRSLTDDEEETDPNAPLIHDAMLVQCENCGTPRCNCVASSSRSLADCSSELVARRGFSAWKEPSTEEEISESSLIYHNKVPVWNPAISAYTLEFCGRALLPSVHNFQLVNDRGDVVLQLGKVRNSEFNMDFGHPLSAFQAFSICLSVIQRTFVWD